MAKAVPTQQQLEEAIPIVYGEMGNLFSYWVWWTQARPILTERFRENLWVCTVLSDSATTTSLLAVRKLNEFFKARPRDNNEFDDDLRAYDYPGFSDTGNLIDPQDYRVIHKLPFKNLCEVIAALCRHRTKDEDVIAELDEIMNRCRQVEEQRNVYFHSYYDILSWGPDGVVYERYKAKIKRRKGYAPDYELHDPARLHALSADMRKLWGRVEEFTDSLRKEGIIPPDILG